MNNTIDFNTAKTIGTMSKKIDHIDDTVSGFFSFMHMVMQNELGNAESYFAAVSPVLDLTVIRPDDAPHILPCFDEADEGIGISEDEPLGFRYNPKQVIKLMGKRYLIGPVIFHRFDDDGDFASLTMSDMYTISLNWKENLPMIKLVHHEMVINSKFLEVPRSYYQRHLNASRVKRIAAEFDERIANAPKVSYRDGHYYVFDGQHTIAARKLLNNNSDLNIVCKVYSGLTEQEEALLFAQQTGISAPLTAGAKLRAKIHGGDPEAIAFQSATQRAGFGLSFNQSHAKWKIACIATAFGEYRQHGERIYTEALRVLAEAWEGDIDSLRSEVLQGVVRFIALYDHEYDPVRLIRQLKRTSPVTIYRSGQAMSGPNYQKYMHQILKAYNGSSRTKSLPIKQ